MTAWLSLPSQVHLEPCCLRLCVMCCSAPMNHNGKMSPPCPDVYLFIYLFISFLSIESVQWSGTFIASCKLIYWIYSVLGCISENDRFNEMLLCKRNTLSLQPMVIIKNAFGNWLYVDYWLHVNGTLQLVALWPLNAQYSIDSVLVTDLFSLCVSHIFRSVYSWHHRMSVRCCGLSQAGAH